LNNQRRQHVVDRAFQARVATSMTIIAALVPLVLILGSYVTWTLAVVNNPALANEPLGWPLLGQIVVKQWWLVLLFLVTFVAFVFALIFYNTHTIAGPVYRFRWLLDELSEGRIHTHVRLRRGDYFENLASSLVRANSTLASTLDRAREATDAAAAASRDSDREVQIQVIRTALERYRVIAPVIDLPSADEIPDDGPNLTAGEESHPEN